MVPPWTYHGTIERFGTPWNVAHRRPRTPRIAHRNADGLYRVEVRWDSTQRSIRPDSFKPQVVVGPEFYPLQLTPLTQNRWEGLVPAPAGQRFVTYHFKFNYLYNSIPMPRADSRLSQTYQLEIADH